MSNPSRATLETEWANALEVLDQVRRFGAANNGSYPAVNATNIVTLLNTLQTSYQGDWLDEAESAVEGIRSAVAGIVSQSNARSVQLPFLKQYCKSVIGRTNLTSDDEMWSEMYKYFRDNSRYVQSRAFTFGSPAAGSNTGNGQIVRLTRDRYNFPIESGYVDSKRAICILDENTGVARGEEVFQVVGQGSARDELERSGSGLQTTFAGLTADDSLLSNAGFTDFGGTAGSDAPTSLTNWTSTDTAGASLAYSSTNYGIDATNYFRALPSGATAGSLQMKVSSRITQSLTTAGQDLDNDTPYLLVVVWNASVGAANGTLNLRMGSITTTVTLTGQANLNVTLVPNPIGQGCWYRNFAEADLDVQIEFIRTSGTLNVAEVMLVPGTLFDGSWYWVLPASASAYTPFRVLDSFTWPDIASGNAVIQTWIARGFPGKYLPSSNGSSIGWAQA